MSSAADPLNLFRPTVAEIDLDAYRRNIAAVRAMLPEDAKIIAVLKSDGYGHGALALAHVCAEEGVAMVAVALLEEGLDLRHRGLTIPILVLGPLMASQIPAAAENDIDLAIVGPEKLRDACSYAQESGKTVAIHLKLDSGMGRMGILESELDEAAAGINCSPSLRLDAIFTHFANAGDEDDPFTQQQIEAFERMTARLRELGVTAPARHSANSAAIFRGLVNPGDYVRVGLALLGGEPLDDNPKRLEPVMRWTSEIARLKTLPLGSPIGYGTTFITPRESRIATLPVGYADGYNRLLSNCGEVLIRGQRAPVVGRVSMDLITVDVTDIEDAALGDEAVLLGKQGDDEITAEEIATKIGTISYEVLCAVSLRVPRLYESGSRTMIASRFPGERRSWPERPDKGDE